MQAIRSILVVIEPEHSESLALKRAKLIAGVTQAHLHLLVCDRKHDHSRHAGRAQGRPAGRRLQRHHRAGLERKPARNHRRRAAGRRLRAGDQAALPRQLAEKSPADPGGLETAAPLPDPGAAGENRRFLEGQGDSGGGRRWQYRWRTPPSAQHHHRSRLRHRQPGQGASACDQRPSVADAVGGRPNVAARAKPSRRAIANSAGRSRPSSTSTTSTCTSRKARRMC